MEDFLLIGNGIAANSAARRLRDLAPDCRITMVTDEAEPYYSRCALMYYVMGHCGKRDTHIADRWYYSDLEAGLIVDDVVAVRAGDSTVELRERGERPYDGLLIACGAVGRLLGVPGEDARGIHSFLTLRDADAVRTQLRGARRGVVIGGGLIGAEAAEVLHELGVSVDWLIREEFFYPVFCSTEQSLIIKARCEGHGVRMHMGCRVTQFDVGADGSVQAVVGDQGARYEADVVIRAIGVAPNVGFLEGSGIETGSGVKVDDRLQTTVENVWAAGDCAEIDLPGRGRSVIEKLWYTAQPQGWVAGENMAGGERRYEPATLYQSAMFMDLDFCSYGDMPAPWNSYEEESVDARNGEDCLRLVHDGGVVVGASFLGKALTKEDIEHLVVERRPLAEARAAAAAVLRGRGYDRAPVSRLSPRRAWSRRPNLWPTGEGAS